MHPLAFIAANVVSLVSSASNSNIGNKGEMASQEAAASVLVLEESKAPINSPLFGAEKSIQEYDAIPTIISIDTPPLHFVFILHGHQGKATDLSYLHHTIRSKAMGKFVDVRSSESCTVGRIKGIHSAQNNSGKIRRRKRDRIPAQVERELDPHYDNYHYLDPNFIPSAKNEQARGSLIVHNAACNEGKTHDGIIKGGERLVDEMLSVIRSEVKRERNNQRDHDVDVTISIVGNSLGGLYGRYAIAILAEMLGNEEFNDYYLFDGFIRIHFNVFCSTASPHLGCASFTYIPIPRTVEMGVAQIMGETGSDLFRRNDLILSMATSPRFLVPLASFQRRIAYANAFGTDFPVPGSTAAFLDNDSDYPHYFGEMLVEGHATTNEIEEKCPATERGLIAAILYTLPQNHNFDAELTMDDDLTTMSACLDRLGWTKIFVDIRKEIPSLPLLNSGGSADCPLRQLKTQSSEVRSCDLAKAISSSSSHRISLPLGHNAICAFSRGKVSSIVNSGGRPVMDSLAIDLTNVISMWNCKLSRRHVK